MRSGRIIVWSTSILLVVILLGCLLLVLLFPWDRFEDKLRESLNLRLNPLRADFETVRFFVRGGPGVSVQRLRLFPSEPPAGQDPLFTCSRVTLRPSLKGLARREVAADLILEAPAIRLGRTAGDGRSFAGVISALAEGIDPDAHCLDELAPLPAGLRLTGASLLIRDGSVHLDPSSGITGIRASFRVDPDLSFKLELTGGNLRWNQDETGPVHLSGTLSAQISQRAVSPGRTKTKGTVRLAEAVIKWQERAAALHQPMQVSFDVEGNNDRVLSVSKFHMTGSGVEIGMEGSSRLSDGPSQIDIQDLIVKVENWEPFCSLLSPETEFSGKLSLVAARIGIDPLRIALPALPSGSFRPTLPEGFRAEGLRIHFSDGRLCRTDLGGYRTSLDGFELRLDQKEHGWTGTMKLAKVEATRGEAFRFSGPAAIKAEWAEGNSGSKVLLVIDLTGGRLACGKLLDKPPELPLQLGVRARILADKIRVGRALLEIGSTEWTFKGSVRNPAEPLLDARLASDIVSLEALAKMFPALLKHEVGGRVEIKELAMTGRLGAFRDSAVLQARVASKDLKVHEASLKGLYAQAIYGKKLLTIHPLLIQPARGMIEADLSADFSQAVLKRGMYPYCGTVRIDHVDIDELAGLAAPSLRGKATGSTDVNLAFRGSGLSWPEAAANLEAKARIYVNHLALEGEGDPAGDPEAGLAGKLGQAVEELKAKEASRKEDTPIGPEQARLLTQNRAAGWFTMQEGSIGTDNLVAVYEGKLVEIRGSLDLSGHLHVDRGKLFIGGRMLPFQLDCKLGEEPCKPRPDLTEMGKSAAAELSDGIRLLSEGARDVFKDLLF